MQFGLAIWGSRGEVEPCVAVGRELVRRGHEVRIGVPPDSVGFAESAGLAPVEYRAGVAGHFGRMPRLLDMFLSDSMETSGSE